MRPLMSSILAVSLFLTFSGTVQAEGNAAAGKLKAVTCESCHGQASSNPLAPRLAGQPQSYTEQQLIAFRDGSRNNPVMKGMVAVLSKDEDVKDVAAYFASLPYLPVNIAKVGAKHMMAESLYLNKCAMCHGERGGGASSERAAAKPSAMGGMFGGGVVESTKDVPLIGGQPEGYLVKALQDYRSGARKSANAVVMDIVSQNLTDSQIASLAKYLNSLSGKGMPGESLAQRD